MKSWIGGKNRVLRERETGLSACCCKLQHLLLLFLFVGEQKIVQRICATHSRLQDLHKGCFVFANKLSLFRRIDLDLLCLSKNMLARMKKNNLS